MTEIPDDRLTLLVFGVHGVAERAVDHRPEVLRVERIQPGGRAEDEIILARIGDDQPDVLPEHAVQHGVQIVCQFLAGDAFHRFGRW